MIYSVGMRNRMNKVLTSIGILIMSSMASAAYEDHFPTYFEYCTGT